LDAGAGKFPKSVCTSINECICHGIPDSRPLQDGDIVNIDVTVFLNVSAVATAAAEGAQL
jgi:methionyl aminopeptidase